MTYIEFKNTEKILNKHRINCFVDPNHWETKDGYVLYFHKTTPAKIAKEYFNKINIETYEILPNVLNAYFKYTLVIKRSQTFLDLIKSE